VTIQARRQRRDLRERRRVRAEKSATRQRETWDQRFKSAETPYDLLGLAYSLVRTRLVQWEDKAAAAVARARTDEDRKAAMERLNTARADVARICGEVADVLARTADQLDTTRR
jgi:hypothetical protein